MRWTLLLVTLAILSFADARRAEACAGGYGDVYGGLDEALVVVGSAYLLTTAAFATYDLVGSDHGKTYGIAELAVNGPITLLYGVAAIDAKDRSNVLKLGAMALLHATLTGHGIYVMYRADERAERAKQVLRPPRPRAAFGPALIPDGAGIGYGGTF